MNATKTIEIWQDWTSGQGEYAVSIETEDTSDTLKTFPASMLAAANAYAVEIADRRKLAIYRTDRHGNKTLMRESR